MYSALADRAAVQPPRHYGCNTPLAFDDQPQLAAIARLHTQIQAMKNINVQTALSKDTVYKSATITGRRLSHGLFAM